MPDSVPEARPAAVPPEVEISRSVSRTLREITGRGAQDVWTTIDRGHVIVMLSGTLTAQEKVLIEHGHAETVTSMRLAVQDLLRTRSSRAVEDATGRHVEGFMSANSFSPDRAVEIFLLADEQPPDGAAS
ncbi:DUF2294 family protein [Thermoleophilia bacterium SCSIO 60948]|nr:DUF2294 family protein [Thermoleophilia bacterium SCSIO 60948]